MKKSNFNDSNQKVKNLKIRKKVLILLTTSSIILTSFSILNHNINIVNAEFYDNNDKTSFSNLITFSSKPVLFFQEEQSNSYLPNKDKEKFKNENNLIVTTKIKYFEKFIESDKNIEYCLEKTDLTTYKYDNETFYIIDTNKGYNNLKKQQKNKCWQYAHAYASDIFRFSDSENLTGTSIGLTSCDISEILQIAACELCNDRPTVIEVNGRPNTNRRHFVTIVGIRKDCDFNNLKQSDFLVLDPAKAKLIRLDTTLSGNNVKRYLINAQDVTYRPPGGENNQYCIEIYNNPDEYLSETCSKTKI